MIHKPSARARSLLLAFAVLLASLASLTSRVDAQEPCGVNYGAPVNEAVRPPLKGFNGTDSKFSVKGVVVGLDPNEQGRISVEICRDRVFFDRVGRLPFEGTTCASTPTKSYFGVPAGIYDMQTIVESSSGVSFSEVESIMFPDNFGGGDIGADEC